MQKWKPGSVKINLYLSQPSGDRINCFWSKMSLAYFQMTNTTFSIKTMPSIIPGIRMKPQPSVPISAHRTTGTFSKTWGGEFGPIIQIINQYCKEITFIPVTPFEPSKPWFTAIKLGQTVGNWILAWITKPSDIAYIWIVQKVWRSMVIIPCWILSQSMEIDNLPTYPVFLPMVFTTRMIAYVSKQVFGYHDISTTTIGYGCTNPKL